ncbi:MAG: AAA family ATPase [Thermomicrobiales bacterium]
MEQRAEVPFKVLLIGGPSGVGKSTAATSLARRLGISWLQVDDLRLALQFSGLVHQEQHSELFFFLDRADWRVSPEMYRDKLIAVARVIAGALRIVVESHLHHDANAIIIEGDGILPEFAATIASEYDGGQVRSVFIVENDEDVLLANMLKRGRGLDTNAAAERQIETRGKALFSDWIQREAEQYGLPIVTPLPWETLPTRLLSARRNA